MDRKLTCISVLLVVVEYLGKYDTKPTLQHQTMASIIPPTYLPYLANTALCMCSVPCFFGIGVLISPEWGLKQASWPIPTNSKDRTLVYGIMRLFGIRDLSLGLTVLAIWYYGEGVRGYKTLGWGMLAGALLPLTDGFVSRSMVRGPEWTMHWPFVPVMAGVGAGLLGWI